MFEFISVVYILAWIGEHIWFVVGAMAVFIGLIILWIVVSRKRRKAYLSLPILYIGNTATKTYHTCSCPKILKSNYSNLVNIRKMDELKKYGMTPCRVCNPHISIQ